MDPYMAWVTPEFITNMIRGSNEAQFERMLHTMQHSQRTHTPNYRMMERNDYTPIAWTVECGDTRETHKRVTATVQAMHRRVGFSANSQGGKSPLAIAIYHANASAISYLYDECGARMSPSFDRTDLLVRLVNFRCIDILQHLGDRPPCNLLRDVNAHRTTLRAGDGANVAGCTALHLAVHLLHPDLVATLLHDFHADCTLTDARGHTPLDWLPEARQSGRRHQEARAYEIEQLLLEARDKKLKCPVKKEDTAESPKNITDACNAFEPPHLE